MGGRQKTVQEWRRVACGEKRDRKEENEKVTLTLALFDLPFMGTEDMLRADLVYRKVEERSCWAFSNRKRRKGNYEKKKTTVDTQHSKIPKPSTSSWCEYIYIPVVTVRR